MSTEIEPRHTLSTVVQHRNDPRDLCWTEDGVIIFDFRSYKIPVTYEELPDFVYDHNISLPALLFQSSTASDDATRGIFTTQFAAMGIPPEDQHSLLEKLYQVVETAVPRIPICVITTEMPAHVSNVWTEELMVDFDWQTINPAPMDADEESIETYDLDLIPATQASIEALEKVRLGSLLQGYSGSTTCAICLEEFSHYVVGVDDQDQLMIARMPCAHHYHVHCIVQSLEVSHLCPLCRYAMPTLELEEPSEP